MQTKDRVGREPDGQHWAKVTTAYRAASGVVGNPAPGTNARTEAARQATGARSRSAEQTAFPVDLYIDPVCPYTWLAACWLREVERHRDLDLRYHPMSLRMLNEHQAMDESYRANLERSVGPSRVATAVWLGYGPDAFRAWHTSFGSMIFDCWRYPSSEEYRTAAAGALRETGLPESLVGASGTAEYDEALRQSHLEGTLPVGVDGGTPVIHLAGVAFFGPVLNAVPTTEEALHLFDGLALLSDCRDFFELKRTRTSPPVFAGPALNGREIPKKGERA